MPSWSEIGAAATALGWLAAIVGGGTQLAASIMTSRQNKRVSELAQSVSEQADANAKIADQVQNVHEKFERAWSNTLETQANQFHQVLTTLREVLVKRRFL